MRRRPTAPAARRIVAEGLESRRLLAVSVIGSFDAGLGELNSIGFDPASGNVFVHASHTPQFHEFTPAGTEVAPAIAAPGASSNDGDLDFTPVATNIAGTPVPAGSLLYFNGDDSPLMVYALDKADGRVIATNTLSVGTVGGSFHPTRGTFVNVDYPSDTIQEIDPATGAELARFPVKLDGAPAFDVFFGDVDVLASTGDLFVVSDSQPVIRELTATGGYVGDIDLTSLGVARMTGLAFDDARGEAWVSSRDGTVYHLGGFQAGGPLGAVQSFDLTDDFSAAANPNGPWRYREGNNLLPHVDWWQRQAGGFTSSAQPGWARSEDGNDRLPFVFKSLGAETFAHDWQAGDVVVHTTDPANGVGSGPANVTWTSPVDGIARVSGGVWMGRDIGRGNDWSILKNGVSLTQGSIFSGDNFSRANPADFAGGSGESAAVQNILVRAGDTISLQLTATNISGDFVGTKFHVDVVAQAPPPAGTVESVNAVSLPGPTPQANDLVTLPDGRILAVGTANQNSGDIALFRLNADGTLDTTFGTGGATFLDVTGSDADDDARALALQPDGKIIVVGTTNEGNGGSNYFVARFTPDGSLDTTFGEGDGFQIADFATETGAPPGTISTDRGTAVAIRPDGGIVIAGVTDALDPNGDFAMAAYNPDGTDDNTFGGNGTTKSGANKLVIPFGEGEVANAVAVQADGKLVIGGSAGGRFALLRLNTDGTIDSTFGSRGEGGGGVPGSGILVSTDLRDGGDGITSLIIQGDGKIVAGGFATTGAEGTNSFDSDFGIARYNADGTIDAAFGTNGIVVTDVPGQIAAISQLAVDAGGNLVAAGRAAAGQAALDNNQFGAAVARYKPSGALDTAFGTNGVLVIPFTNLTASLRAGPASILAAVIQNPGADAVRQQALIALSAQGKLRVLLTAGGQVRVATVSGDAGAPTATIAQLASVTDLGLPAQTFVVDYADDLAIDVSTLGTGDILVSGPGVTDQPAELVSVDNNANGTPRRATYRFVPPGGSFTAAQNGTYQLSIAADQVKDTSGFSLASGPVDGATFTVNINADAANLVAGPLTGKLPTSVVGGGKASGASVLVTNNGTQPAVGTIAVRLVASLDGTVDDSDATIATVNQKVNLKPGKAKALKLKFKTFPANLPDGDYFLLAQIDSANAIPETADNLDNVGATANPIRIAAPFVDLGFAGGAGGFKSPLAPGKKGTLAVPLRNSGNIPAKATVSANLFASLDQAMSGDDRSLGTLPVKASLKASTTKNAKLKFTLPADLAPGQYFLILVLNPAGNDRDPADNTAFSAVPLTVG